MGDQDLKYRKRLSTTVDKGIYKAIYNYSIDSGLPLSRLLDTAIGDFLAKNNIPFEVDGPYKKERIK